MEKRHLKRRTAAWILPVIGLLLPACGVKAPLLDVLEGNSRYAMGDYAGATVNYMQALDNQKYEEWIYYNLGNTYSALGEIEPAILQYEKAGNEEDPELRFRTNFNLGNLYYELGEYQQSVAYYRESLKARPGSIDAKINLELAIKKYTNKLEAGGSLQPGSPARLENIPREMLDILETTRLKEEEVWKEITVQEPTHREPDW